MEEDLLIFIQMYNFKTSRSTGTCELYNEWCEFSNIPGSNSASLEIFEN